MSGWTVTCFQRDAIVDRHNSNSVFSAVAKLRLPGDAVNGVAVVCVSYSVFWPYVFGEK